MSVRVSHFMGYDALKFEQNVTFIIRLIQFLDELVPAIRKVSSSNPAAGPGASDDALVRAGLHSAHHASTGTIAVKLGICLRSVLVSSAARSLGSV
jgi:hypothetical protein